MHKTRWTYLDELICLFRKARPGIFVQFQDKDVKTHLLNSLPSEILKEIQGYLDLTAEEIAWKYDLIHSQREALGIFSAVKAEKALHVVEEKSVGGVETYTTDDLKHIEMTIISIGLGMNIVPIVTRKNIQNQSALRSLTKGSWPKWLRKYLLSWQIRSQLAIMILLSVF